MDHEATQQYKLVASKINALLSIEDKPGNEGHYWLAHKEVKEELSKLIYMDFSAFNGRRILLICAWVSTYRPVEPFRFLSNCSALVSKHADLKKFKSQTTY